MTTQAALTWLWDQGFRSHPRHYRLRCKHTGTGFRSICEWWPVRSSVACIRNTGWKSRRRDHDTIWRTEADAVLAQIWTAWQTEIDSMVVRVHPHARERMEERGATEEEMRATVEQGEPFPAKFGRTGFRRNFRFDQYRHGRHDHTKQVEAYAVQEGPDWLVITVLTRYF